VRPLILGPRFDRDDVKPIFYSCFRAGGVSSVSGVFLG